MSKRYGRNQKRKAKEQIAELNSQVAAASRNLDQNKDSLVRIRRLLGDYFSGLDSKCVSIPIREIEMLKTVNLIQDDVDWPNYSLSEFGKGQLDHVYNVLSVPVMKTHVDKIAENVHVLVDYGGDRFAYAISEAAVKSADIDYLASKISIGLAQEIKNFVSRGAI